MAYSTVVKNILNRVLAATNLRVETLTEVRSEKQRIERLAAAGHFERAVFPLPESFTAADVSELLQSVPQYHARFDTFRDASQNDVGFSFANEYFRSPDAEIFYTLVRRQNPTRIVEVGSGHSTKIARQAIIDGKIRTSLTSIDPQPRTEIDWLTNECLRQRVEDSDLRMFDALQPDDILFIDSSHEICVGSDVAFLYSVVLPRLTGGVLVHIHDIFLPYDYPSDLIANGAAAWNEQHIVHSMLLFGSGFEVIWPGYFLQQTRPDFATLFPHNKGERAQSLWLRKISPALR